MNKSLFRLMLGLACSALLIGAAAPTILSTEWGLNLLVRGVNARITGHLTAKRLSLSWSGPQRLEGWSLEDPSSHSVFNLETFSTEASLPTLLKNRADVAAVNFRAVLHGKNIPARLVESLSGRKEIEPLFGSIISVDLSVDLEGLEGPFSLTIKGEKGYVNLHAQHSDGTLTLQQPFVLETQATPELGKEIFGQFSPIFRELSSADKPLKLTIHPEKVSLPLKSLDWARLSVKNIVLETGRMQFYNSGEVAKLVNLLGKVHSEQISVWATPLYLSIQDGVLTVRRVDMLVLDRYPIAAWGVIDLPRDRLDMTIGLSGRAIANAKNLTNVDDNIMIPIPYKGHPIRKAQIDVPTAVTRVGAVVAQHSSLPEAVVLGTLFKLVNGKQESVPAPTTSPLPWTATNGSNGAKERTEENGKLKKAATKLKFLQELFR